MFPFKNKLQQDFASSDIHTLNASDSYVDQAVLESEIRNQEVNFGEIPEDTDIKFAQLFTDRGGKFIYSQTRNQLFEMLNQFLITNDLHKIFVWEEELLPLIKERTDAKIKIERVIDESKVAVSCCEALLADEGSLILSAHQNQFRPLDKFPKFHVILADRSQVKLNIEHGVTDYLKKFPLLFPFLIDLSKEEKPTRFAANKPILKSNGTKDIYLFYCEESIFG